MTMSIIQPEPHAYRLLSVSGVTGQPLPTFKRDCKRSLFFCFGTKHHWSTQQFLQSSSTNRFHSSTYFPLLQYLLLLTSFTPIMPTQTRERKLSTSAPISDIKGPVGPEGISRPKHKRTATGFGAAEIKSVEASIPEPQRDA